MRERVVALLREMADVMRAAGDPVRMRAYARAAENVERRKDFDDLLARRRVRQIAGVGPSIEGVILAFVERGERPAWLDDRARLPSSIRGTRATRDRAGSRALLLEGPPEAYFAAPFPRLPDLHVHTTWSDGTLSLEEVVLWAQRLGAPAVGISDHSRSLRIANGLRPAEVRAQWEEIARVQAKHPAIRILCGTECDILRDGSLDHPEEILAGFDYVIVGLHSRLKLDVAAQTRRVLRALDHERVTILAHPTTRIPGRRPPAKLDLDRVFERAAERGVAVEVNGNPGRVDLDVPLARRALEAGCKLAVGSDGHSASEMLAFAAGRWMAVEAGARQMDLVNASILRAAAGAPARDALTSP